MVEGALFIVHYALVLLYGILLSAAFAGVRMTRGNAVVLGGLFVVCGLAQMAALAVVGEDFVWRAYPLLAHVPMLALLCLRYRKRISTALASVATAYMCCQLAKWIGILVTTLTGNYTAEQLACIIALPVLGYLLIRYAADCMASIYNKDTRSVLIFGMVPFVYYLFDYSMAVYSDYWPSGSGVAAEFLPFFLCAAFLTFCVVYHQAYERQTESERREQIARIALEQQAHELDAVRRSEDEVRMLRHDMKLFLSGVSHYLDEGDVEAAQKMLSEYLESIEATVVHRWCGSDMVNYVISDCCGRCEEASIKFEPVVEVKELPVNETAFFLILSNALNNAINAQKALPDEERRVKLLLKVADGKLLLVVRNACAVAPMFVDGMPVTREPGHGYGTQSIRYMTERLGGTCQFRMDGGQFVLRVVIGL